MFRSYFYQQPAGTQKKTYSKSSRTSAINIIGKRTKYLCVFSTARSGVAALCTSRGTTIITTAHPQGTRHNRQNARFVCYGMAYITPRDANTYYVQKKSEQRKAAQYSSFETHVHISILILVGLRWAALARASAEQRNSKRSLRLLASRGTSRGAEAVQLVFANVDLCCLVGMELDPTENKKKTENKTVAVKQQVTQQI